MLPSSIRTSASSIGLSHGKGMPSVGEPLLLRKVNISLLATWRAHARETCCCCRLVSSWYFNREKMVGEGSGSVPGSCILHQCKNFGRLNTDRAREVGYALFSH